MSSAVSRNALVHASVGRTGLGNMMFPWARAEVFRHRFGVPMLAPQWTKPKVGPLLRREKDLRYYSGLFDNRTYVGGWGRVLALLSRKRIDGASIGINADPAVLPPSSEGGLIVFHGWQGWFRDDLPIHREFLRERLAAIMSEGVRRQIRAFDKPLEVALHVRRGDMGKSIVPPGAEIGRPDANVGQSEYYFLSTLRTIRRIAGRPVSATVFTDAQEGELKELPAEENVHMAGSRSVTADLWCMSQAAVFISSSASSLSAWASYVGGMPTIWARTRIGVILPDRVEHAIESDPHGAISERAGEIIRERLDRSRSEARHPGVLVGTGSSQ